MDPINRYSVEAGNEGKPRSLSELVMAWARDSESGAPTYILELGPDRRGSRCRCECAGCGLPLTAVNAARAQFIKRPHFRHPEGADSTSCYVLAARLAALKQLHNGGWIELPARRRSKHFRGLSGQLYEGAAEHPRQRLRILNTDFTDRARAVLTLDDGREIAVELVGAVSRCATSEDRLIPAITIEVDDPLVAAMAPNEIARRLKLEGSGVCWRSHWMDALLDRQAEEAAREEALLHLDETPDWVELPQDLDVGLRRETVLHLVAKRLLEEAGQVHVPGLVVEASSRGDGSPCRSSWSRPARRLRLKEVVLECPQGRLVPDVSCVALGEDGEVVHPRLLIEVTVTNPISPEREMRIRAAGHALLEIDLSHASQQGKVDLPELRRLVIEDLETKRWVFHPEGEAARVELQNRLDQQSLEEQARRAQQAQRAEQERKLLEELELPQLAQEYLWNVESLLQVTAAARIRSRFDSGLRDEVQRAQEAVAKSADRLAHRGYPEAADGNLIEAGGLIQRLLAIRHDRPIGFRHQVVEELVEISNSVGTERSLATIYLIAVRHYRPSMNAEQSAWFEEWAQSIRQSLLSGDPTFARDPFYDRILSLLFPEMASALAKPFGKRTPELLWDAAAGRFKRTVPERRTAEFIKAAPRRDRRSAGLLDTLPSDLWLKGRDLEAWKRANPEAAAEWFKNRR